MGRYPCLRLALEAAQRGESYPAAMSAANEVAVDLFLSGKIGFEDLPAVVEEVLSRHQPVELDSAEAVLQVDAAARREALTVVRNRSEN